MTFFFYFQDKYFVSLAPCLQETKLQFIILLPFFHVVVGANVPSEINESFALFDNNSVCRWAAPSVYTEEAFPFYPDDGPRVPSEERAG